MIRSKDDEKVSEWKTDDTRTSGSWRTCVPSSVCAKESESVGSTGKGERENVRRGEM